MVHPQHWPADLDVNGKRVVVIGSGATALTLVPALTAAAAKVTMLQRSPSYVMPIASVDPIAALLRRVVPERAYDAIRWKNVRMATAIYTVSRKYPARVRAMLRSAARKRLPAGFDVDTHFTLGAVGDHEPTDGRSTPSSMASIGRSW